MKTIILIIALATFQITPTFGGTIGDKTSLMNIGETICVECPFLSPVVPLEASYEDQHEVTTLMVQEFLTPEIPMVADFSDSEIPMTPNEQSLVPQVPAEADFQDIP
ncbi:MAG: hypothetical protein ISS19_12250 [Bacteroidales bacterium]|nr:hypothetical protein [Bacteroidales bacterium]